MIHRLTALMLFLTLGACFRRADSLHVIALPEAASESERTALRDHLLQFNTRVHPDHPLYFDIGILHEPPALRVRFNPEMTAPKNIEHKLADLGYTANALPGNSDTRSAFRARLAPQP